MRIDDTNYIIWIEKHKKHKLHKKFSRPFKVKSCLGCKAYVNDDCQLRVPIEVIKDDDKIKVHRPKAQTCSKPRTIKQLLKLEQ